MRPKFSLRMLLLLTTIVALICYGFILPTLKAQKFVDAVDIKDFSRADNFFLNPVDRFLVNSNERHWGFIAEAKLAPWSLAQLVSANRSISLYIKYFEFDETHEIRAQLTATPFGVQRNDFVSNTAPLIDRMPIIDKAR